MSDDDFSISDGGYSDAGLDESFGEPKPVRLLWHSISFD